MHPVANHLIQLQELILIRDEQKVSGINHHLEQLNSSIAVMAGQLQGDTKAHFEKLSKKDRNQLEAVSKKIQQL